MMRLMSAYEDFTGATLGAIRGVMARLTYIASLRGPDGRYRHWGLTKVYGDEAAQAAIARAHTSAFLQVLRTPLQQLVADPVSTAVLSVTPVSAAGALVPADLGGGSARHLSWLLNSLSRLDRARAASNRPAASPLQLPGR